MPPGGWLLLSGRKEERRETDKMTGDHQSSVNSQTKKVGDRTKSPGKSPTHGFVFSPAKRGFLTNPNLSLNIIRPHPRLPSRIPPIRRAGPPAGESGKCGTGSTGKREKFSRG